jgi:hypothetical protein
MNKELLKEYIKDSLVEGRGMVARKEGEEYENKDGKTGPVGEKLKFFQTFIFPSKALSYSSSEETNSKVSYAFDLPEIKPGASSPNKRFVLRQIVNKPNAASKAAMVVVMLSEDGKKQFGFLKYFPNMSSKGFGKWTDSDFARDTGFSRSKGVSVLETMPIKVSDFITDFHARNLKQVQETVLGRAASLVGEKKIPPLIQEHIQQLFAAALSNGPSPILKGARKYRTVYEKYIGELFAPISLITGWLSEGQRDESEKILVTGKNPKVKFGNMLIRFPQSLTNLLTDSEVIYGNDTNPTIRVGVSSKAATSGGAAASLTGLYRTIKDEKIPPKFLKSYESVVRFIELIYEKSSVEGPLVAAQILGILTEKEGKYVASLFGGTSALHTLPQFKTLIKNKKLAAPTKNLLRLAELLGGFNPLSIKKTLPNYKPGYHFLAGIAKAIASQANSSDLFDKAVRGILNYSSMVQIYLSIKNVGPEDIQFASFFVKYPPNFEGKVVLNSDKNYYASAPPKGKIGFKLV